MSFDIDEADDLANMRTAKALLGKLPKKDLVVLGLKYLPGTQKSELTKYWSKAEIIEGITEVADDFLNDYWKSLKKANAERQ